MIEGTKPYKKFRDAGTNAALDFVPTPPIEAVHPKTSTTESPPGAAAPSRDRKLDRRAWFRSLVPSLGTGLVEILRTSNHLERELDELRKK